MIDRKAALSRYHGHMKEVQTGSLGPGGAFILPGTGTGENGLFVLAATDDGKAWEEGRIFTPEEKSLFTKILGAVGLKAEESYFSGLVYQPAPGQTMPEIEDVLRCQSWIEGLLALLEPKVIVTLGEASTRWLIYNSVTIDRVRGRWYTWRNLPLRPLFHPKDLLLNPSRSETGPKNLTWIDIQAVKARLEEGRS